MYRNAIREIGREASKEYHANKARAKRVAEQVEIQRQLANNMRERSLEIQRCEGLRKDLKDYFNAYRLPRLDNTNNAFTRKSALVVLSSARGNKLRKEVLSAMNVGLNMVLGQYSNDELLFISKEFKHTLARLVAKQKLDRKIRRSLKAFLAGD